MSRPAWWGIRILTGPDMWWMGDDVGPYAMDQVTAERIASLLNIRSNDLYFLIKAYRSKPFLIDEYTNPRHGSNPIELSFAKETSRDRPHYRYAAAPLPSATRSRPIAEKLLLGPAPSTARPGQNPGQATRKRANPKRRRC